MLNEINDEVENDEIISTLREYLRSDIRTSANFQDRVMAEIQGPGPHNRADVTALVPGRHPYWKRRSTTVIATCVTLAAAVLIFFIRINPPDFPQQLTRSETTPRIQTPMSAVAHPSTNEQPSQRISLGTYKTRPSNPYTPNTNAGIAAHPPVSNIPNSDIKVSAMPSVDTTGTVVTNITQLHRFPTIVAFDKRFSDSLHRRLESLVDSLASVGLPTEPLIDKALEGSGKGIDEGHILAAVQKTATNLGAARTLLGAVQPDELAAAAVALGIGASSKDLTAMRRELKGRSLAIPYSILSTLITQGMPPNDAASTVVAQAKRSDDRALIAFGRAVESRVAQGLPVRTAVVEAGGSVVPISGPPSPKPPKAKP